MKLQPKLLGEAFEYKTINHSDLIPENAVAMVKEHESISIIVPTQKTSGKLWAWIVNDTVTDLEATGITATFSAALNNAKIPCNVIAGYYHDHILVPFHMREKSNFYYQKCKNLIKLGIFGTPYGNRTRHSTVRGWCLKPIDQGCKFVTRPKQSVVERSE